MDEKITSTPPEIVISSYDVSNIYIANKDVNNKKYLEQYKNTKLFLKLNSIKEFLNFRFSLDFGKGKLGRSFRLEDIQLLGLSPYPHNIKITFKNKNENVREHNLPPLKANQQIENLKLAENIKIPKDVSKVYYDGDLRAKEGLTYLYEKGRDIGYISQILSVGGMGISKNRKIIPTKYAITASDSIISQQNIEKIKDYDIIQKYYVYEGEAYDNHFIIIFMPSYYAYELIEIIIRERISVKRDFEIGRSRTTYVEETAGGYYAIRLSISDKLRQLKSQAKVVVLREIKPQYYMSVGVWVLREAVREILKSQPNQYDSWKDVVRFVKSRAIEEQTTHELLNSKVFKEHVKQKTLF